MKQPRKRIKAKPEYSTEIVADQSGLSLGEFDMDLVLNDPKCKGKIKKEFTDFAILGKAKVKIV